MLKAEREWNLQAQRLGKMCINDLLCVRIQKQRCVLPKDKKYVVLFNTNMFVDGLG